jgi:hypothetical protein
MNPRTPEPNVRNAASEALDKFQRNEYSERRPWKHLHRNSEMLSRRQFIHGLTGLGAGTVLALTGNSPASWSRSTPVASSGEPSALTLRPDELPFLRSDWFNQTENEPRRLLRAHGARVAQLQILAQAAGIDYCQDPPSDQPVRWPWKGVHEFHQRVQEARVHFRRTRPTSDAPSSDDLKYVHFRPDEASFLLHWEQEYWDWCYSNEEWNKGWRYYPTCRIVRETLPALPYGSLLRFSLALFEEVGLNQFEAAALPLKPDPPSVPWRTMEEFSARQRDVDAYEIRKEKFNLISDNRRPGMLPNLTGEETAYLEAWLQERLWRKQGPARNEQENHGAYKAQLMNLVWASGMEIEPRAVTAAPWPWRSQEEFHGRLQSAAARLFPQCRFRPKSMMPFRPEEDRFVTAWIQEESEENRGHCGQAIRPVLDLIKTQVPEMVDKNALNRSEWFKLRKIQFAWLKARGTHEQAVAGGPPPEGPIEYPWKDRAEFEARLQEAERINKPT